MKQHKRDNPSAFVCDRCNTEFPSRKGLRDHQRLPKEEMCDIAEHDLESGIDGPTSNKLLSRKRASGASPAIQWREIWNILFPDDEDSNIKPYCMSYRCTNIALKLTERPADYTPVIEHFEVSDSFEKSFKVLQTHLREMMGNPATLDTLATKFHQCYLETVSQCTAEAQNMPYVNRSNKRSEPNRVQSTSSVLLRKATDAPSRPDSGVILDDGSSESGSIMGTGLRHRASVRTVREGGRRDSSRTVDAHRDLLPFQSSVFGVFDERALAQLSSDADGMAAFNSAPMDPVSVQSWNDAVLSQQHIPHTLPPTSGEFSSVGDVTAQNVMYDAYYDTLSFPNIVGRQDSAINHDGQDAVLRF